MTAPDTMQTSATMHQRRDDHPTARFVEAGAASHVVVDLSSPVAGPLLFVSTPEYLDALIRELSNVAVTWQVQRHDAEVPC